LAPVSSSQTLLSAGLLGRARGCLQLAVPHRRGIMSAWDQPSAWDLSQSPLILAGADGQAYETRPTTSLARDLAEAEVNGFTDESNASSRPNRFPDPDDRPIRPAAQRSPDNRTARRNSADRPLGGFAAGGGGSPSSAPSERRASRINSKEFPAASETRRASAAGYVGTFQMGSGSGSSSPFAGGAMSTRRRSSTGSIASCSSPTSQSLEGGGGGTSGPRRVSNSISYAPVDTLVNMGFDKELARVAIAAAGGDIDRAVRIMLEDSQAHDARTHGDWEFEGDKGWAPFDQQTDATLSEAFNRGESATEIRAGGNRYLVDFDTFTQLNLNSKKMRNIRRRGAGASSSSSGPAPGSSSGYLPLRSAPMYEKATVGF